MSFTSKGPEKPIIITINYSVRRFVCLFSVSLPSAGCSRWKLSKTFCSALFCVEKVVIKFLGYFFNIDEFVMCA